MLACGASTALNSRELRAEVLCPLTTSRTSLSEHWYHLLQKKRVWDPGTMSNDGSKAAGVLQGKAMVAELFSAVPSNQECEGRRLLLLQH